MLLDGFCESTEYLRKIPLSADGWSLAQNSSPPNISVLLGAEPWNTVAVVWINSRLQGCVVSRAKVKVIVSRLSESRSTTTTPFLEAHDFRFLGESRCLMSVHESILF